MGWALSLWPGKIKCARIPVCESSGKRVEQKDGRAALNRMQTGGWTDGITRNNFFGFFFFLLLLLLEIHPHFLLIIDEVCGDRRCTLRLMFVLLQLFFVLFLFFLPPRFFFFPFGLFQIDNEFPRC